MPGTCGLCDERVVEQTNSDGDYKGACKQCRETHDRTPRHVDQCDDPDCLVCRDYAEEFGE